MTSARVLRSIEEAAGDGRLVKVKRRKGWDRLDGSVVSRSSKWLILAVQWEAGFDGHALIRVADVRHVETFANDTFITRALANEGNWPLPRLEDVDLSSTRAAVRTLTEAGGLLSIHYEQDHPDETLIGVPRKFGKKKFRLQNVNTKGKWDYRSVSRIDVGNSYARRLLSVAGPPPPE